EAKPSRETWEQLERIYDRAISIAREIGLVSLAAHAAKAKIILRAEYLNDLTNATRFGEEFLEDVELSAAHQFLISEIIARQFLYKGKEDTAHQWFDTALAVDSEAYPEVRVWTHLELAKAQPENQLDTALQHLHTAETLARQNPIDISETRMVTTLGELGLMQWEMGNRTASFDAFDEAADRLLPLERNDDVKRLIAILGHSLGYYEVFSATGEPPSSGPDGEPYAVPARGQFMNWNREQVDWFDSQDYESFLPAIFSLLCRFADAVGRRKRAEYWALNGLQQARDMGLMAVAGILAYQCLPALLRTNRFEEAIDTMYEAATSVKAEMIALQSGADINQQGLEATTFLGQRPNENWKQAEEMAVQQSIMMIILRLGYLQQMELYDVKILATQCVDSCRRYAEGSAVPGLWEAVAELLESTFCENTKSNALKERAEELGRECYAGLHPAGYLCSSLASDISLSAAAITQLVFLEYLDKNVRGLNSLTAEVTAPFIFTYWQRAFKSRRFDFRAPALVEPEFAGAAESQSMTDIKRLMRAIVSSVIGRLPKKFSDVSDWLYS
ncbi:MAG: hypothetical protein J3T61_06015, partial [Candidatus Brocadiales bacterium]|nr:hypothetical protein [Candidatus Bathyanammoxibius sp.]